MKKNKLRYREIIAESIYSEENNGKVILFCAGMPGSSSYFDVAERYTKQGFIFIHPKYIGSWESYGNFSIENSKKTIIDFVAALRRKEVKTIFEEEFDVKVKEIYLLGTSFGGSVALCAGAESDVEGIIALSPVINYQTQGNGEYQEESMNDFLRFVKAGFENVYRGFTESDWKQNISLLNVDSYFEKLKAKKILIMHGAKDTSVNHNRSEEFCSKLKNLGGDICYEKTEDDHSSIKLNSFEKVSSWIVQ